MADAPEVMNIRQASEYLGVSPDTLYKYVSEEKIPAFKLGNRWKFKKTILDAWMEQQSASAQGSQRAPARLERSNQECSAPPQKAQRMRLSAKRVAGSGSGE
jgi:excisionase family DNA binding protein